MRASLRSNDIHLTGLRLLAPHLTEANHTLVLQRAKRRTRQEIAEIVAALAPKTPGHTAGTEARFRTGVHAPQLELRAAPPREPAPEVSMPPSPGLGT